MREGEDDEFIFRFLKFQIFEVQQETQQTGLSYTLL